MILFIRGDISIAPMMTATEFVFNPTEAIKMAQIMMTMLVPRNLPPDMILSLISSWLATSSRMEKTILR